MKKLYRVIRNRIHDFLFPPIEKRIARVCLIQEKVSDETIEELEKILEEYKIHRISR